MANRQASDRRRLRISADYADFAKDRSRCISDGEPPGPRPPKI